MHECLDNDMSNPQQLTTTTIHSASVTPSKIVPVKIRTLSPAGCNSSTVVSKQPLSQPAVTPIIMPYLSNKVAPGASTQGNMLHSAPKGTKTKLILDSKLHMKNSSAESFVPEEAIPNSTFLGNKPHGIILKTEPSVSTQKGIQLSGTTVLDPPKGIDIEGVTTFYSPRGAPKPRPHVCQFCNYAFPNQSALIRHRKTKHTGTFICMSNKGFTFWIANSLGTPDIPQKFPSYSLIP